MARHGENIRKRSDGRWEARLLIGKSADGKTRYKYLYGKSYAEVKEKRNRLLAGGIVMVPNPDLKKATFGQLLQDWLVFIRPDVKESTYAKYVFDVKKHIEPELGGVPLVALSTADIDRFTRRKMDSGSLSGKDGLAPKTVSCLLSLIKLALEFGRERDYGCPEQIVIHNPRQTLPDIQILSLQEQSRLEQFINAHPCPVGLGVMLSLYTGLRIGEVCAMQWEDICLEQKVLHVQRTITRIQDVSPEARQKTKVVIGAPKTECSNRQIPIPDFLVELLQPYQKSGELYLLTGTKDYLEPRNYYLKYKRMLRECGVKDYNYHALRHTFATRCVEKGVDAKSLSEILGHADVSTTLRRYVHPSLEMKRRQMAKLTSCVFRGQQTGLQKAANH